MGNFKEDIVRVKAFVFDVDGVMTDGGIMPIGDGSDFIRKYNAKDGYAIAYAVRRGYKVCIISGGHGNLLRRRDDDSTRNFKLVDNREVYITRSGRKIYKQI